MSLKFCLQSEYNFVHQGKNAFIDKNRRNDLEPENIVQLLDMA